MLIDKKVKRLRRQMRKNKLAAYIINGTDPHKSEYVCDRYQTRKWISGFTGSAGTVVITKDQALLWVDSRYYVQCQDQIKDTCFEMKKIDGPEATNPIDFLKENLKKGAKVGISAETLMVSEERNYKKKGLNVVSVADLLDKIWKDRPELPSSPIVDMPVMYSGETTESKISRIREAAKKDGAKNVLISSLDDIAWTLNLRGSDIEDTPVFLSYLLITPDSVQLFTSLDRELGFGEDQITVTVVPYDKVVDVLKKLEGSVALNPKTTNMKIYNALKNNKIIEVDDYSTKFKACKNEVEMAGMRKAHVLDGVALVNFMARVEARETSFTEVSIAKMLEEERKKAADYLGPSFATIAGFADHGAVVHYSATEETDKPIVGSGLLVLDSGGQYSFGTTDVTRTLLFGRPSREQKEDYTLVLKGHLALGNSVFPKGTSGHQLDVLAHRPLWQNGLTYFHGTGHGVGCRLSVHEGPQRISTYPSDVALEPGMVISNEPGIYKEGKHGIRIENLVAVKEHLTNEFGTFYAFETLTCCPYEQKLIAKDLLTAGEIKKINTYHKWVWDNLKELVTPAGKEWLKRATMPL